MTRQVIPKQEPATPSAQPPAEAPELRGQLKRWVRDGLISQEQAERIAAAEGAIGSTTEAPAAIPTSPEATETPETPEAPESTGFMASGRGGFVVEALGYLGGTLAAIAGFIAVNQLWPDLPTWAEMTFAAAAAVFLLVAGVLVQATADPALVRLRSVLLVLSTGSLLAFVALLTVRVWNIHGISAALLISATTAVYAGGLWWRWPTPVQHLVFFAALATAVGTGVGRLDLDLLPWSAGLAVWLLSAGWAELARRSLVQRPVGGLAAAVGLLVGAQLTMEYAAGNVLAVATVGGLLIAGVILRQVPLLGLGAFGVVQVAPQVVTRYLPDTVAAPLAVFVIGLVLLSCAVWLSRGHAQGHPRTDRQRTDRHRSGES